MANFSLLMFYLILIFFFSVGSLGAKWRMHKLHKQLKTHLIIFFAKAYHILELKNKEKDHFLPMKSWVCCENYGTCISSVACFLHRKIKFLKLLGLGLPVLLWILLCLCEDALEIPQHDHRKSKRSVSFLWVVPKILFVTQALSKLIRE